MPYRPALARLRRSTRYAVLGLAAIAIAGCVTEEQRQANREKSERGAAIAAVKEEYSGQYRTCINRVASPWSSASEGVMIRCEAQACFAVRDEASWKQPIPCQMREIDKPEGE